ncbi:hypothetical protein MPL3356_40252 [Mesorhizobium plurifarium]|uniref:Uncharacterized protein n=1 Tax=Mesorhizobium plurifarium TaxID=69974 RepID=A0A090E710_MESPL|nr:hypothetical protein MPL3356_40252 [Mesorhizobium plurifarium]
MKSPIACGQAALDDGKFGGGVAPAAFVDNGRGTLKARSLSCVDTISLGPYRWITGGGPTWPH